MTDHDPNQATALRGGAAAVLDKLRDEMCGGYLPGPCCCEEVDARRLIDAVIDAVYPAFTAAGYAIVKMSAP